MNPLLEINSLQTHFFTHNGTIQAVDDVSLTISNGEMVGIVGESGCGKSVLARSVMRLIPNPPGRIVGGEIKFMGQNILTLPEKEMQRIRGDSISMIFQEPMTSLNPVYTTGDQLAEVFRKHRKASRKEARERAVELFKLVGIPSPETRIKEYPFQMSGGMRQRVVIAMALACRPKLILADEPTTALDVTIQAQILRLISDLKKELGTSMVLITHDLGVIAETVSKVIVMYAGKVVEEGNIDVLLQKPLHPYTEGLMRSMPTLDKGENKDTNTLHEISGIVPDLSNLPKGCSFHPRCPRRFDVCRKKIPDLITQKNGQKVRCFLHD